ncbi:MAG: serine/threonine-protein kinase [Chloroflexota bacterium]
MIKIGMPENHLPIGAVLLGRYKISGVISIHEMSRVYQARDMNFPNVVRHVAIREILPVTSYPNRRTAIYQEFEKVAKLFGELDHPAIPHIYECFESKQCFYLVMEYDNGLDLAHLIHAYPYMLPPLDMVIKWAVELCDVLDYLHTQQPAPIIFRNLKPSNILINHYGRTRLVDFGLARAGWGQQSWMMIGTEGYSAPELQTEPASPRSDIYSLAATLYHLLTRHDPNLGQPFSFADHPSYPTHSGNPVVLSGLEAIITRALMVDPSKRYPDALSMKQALEALPTS